MEIKEKEVLVLQIIRYAPLFFILFLSIFITLYISYEHSRDLEIDKNNTKKNFVKLNKEIIQANIETTISKYIDKQYKKSESLLKDKLKRKINNVHKIATNIYNKNRNTLSKNEIIKHIKDSIEVIRFDEEKGYFGIYTMEGINILHPINPEFEGTNLQYIKDIKGNYPVHKAIELLKTKEEGFLDWYYFKQNNKSKEYKKIGIVKKFEPYNLIITTSMYLDDFEKIIKKEILDHLSMVRYRNNENIFVLDNEGNILLSKNRKFDGINIFKTKNINLSNMQQKEFINSNEKTKFIEYKPINNKEKEYQRVSYIKKIEGLNWIVGTNFNLSEVNILIKEKQQVLEKHYQKHLKVFYLSILFVTILLLIVSYYISKYIRNRFHKFKKKLLEKNIKLLQAQKIAKLGEWELDLKTNKAYYSEKVITIFGLQNTEKDCGPELLKTIMYNSDWPYFESSLLTCINTRKEHVARYRVRRPIDGKTAWIECRGELTQKNTILGIVQDITEIKELEEEKQQKDRLLIQQSKMATMGEMIENIVHQWKQPLSLISMSNGLVRLNQIDRSFSTQKEVDEALENIDNSVQHLSSTIDDFRNFFRPDKEKMFFNLKSTFDKINKLINSQLKNNSIKIIDKIDDIEVYGYKNELLQVFINIIKNAKDELVKLDRNQKRLLFVSTYLENNNAIIKIKDNAGGIPDNIINKIFDAYFTTKEATEGTGIGLYMSKQIIEGMDGIIKVSNVQYNYEKKTYKGAEFIIKMPL